MLRDSFKATQEVKGADVQIKAAWLRQSCPEPDFSTVSATFNLKLTASESTQPFKMVARS